jgi:uncharacterized integral membrane protein
VSRFTGFTGAAGLLVVLLMVMFFARWNAGVRVTLDLGFTTLYRIPVTYVAFGGLFVGMLVMLVAGIHSDLKDRRYLRDRLEAEGREERLRIDRTQQDLFTAGSEAEEEK